MGRGLSLAGVPPGREDGAHRAGGRRCAPSGSSLHARRTDVNSRFWRRRAPPDGARTTPGRQLDACPSRGAEFRRTAARAGRRAPRPRAVAPAATSPRRRGGDVVATRRTTSPSGARRSSEEGQGLPTVRARPPGASPPRRSARTAPERRDGGPGRVTAAARPRGGHASGDPRVVGDLPGEARCGRHAPGGGSRSGRGCAVAGRPAEGTVQGPPGSPTINMNLRLGSGTLVPSRPPSHDLPVPSRRGHLGPEACPHHVPTLDGRPHPTPDRGAPGTWCRPEGRGRRPPPDLGRPGRRTT